MIKAVIFSVQVAGIVAIAYSGAKAEPLKVTITPTVYVSETANVSASDKQCLTEAIYFEARNQTFDGMMAVGNVILNRVASPDFPDSICGVVHQGPLDGSPITKNRCQFSYYCDGKSDKAPRNDLIEIMAWDLSNIVGEVLLFDDVNDNTKGSTYYHAYYVDPFWNDVYTQVAVVDSHQFYIHYD